MTIKTFDPRPYQRETLDDIYRLWGVGLRRVVGVMPTGGGKTVLGVTPVVDCVRAGRRVLWLAHRTELIESAEESIKADSSGLDVGVLQGARKEFNRSVIVGSVLTVNRPAALAVLRTLNIGLIVVDECHHSVAPSYMSIMRELGAFEPDGPLVLGLTATLARSDGLALSDLWQEVAKPVEIGRLINEGWLLRPRGIRVKVEGFDPRTLKASKSQAATDRVYGEALSGDLAPEAIARAVQQHCAGRVGVAFLPTVAVSKRQAEAFAAVGLRAVHVDDKTPKAVRREIFRRARAGQYDVVCNVGIATEGTDVPIWSFAVLGRMTSSEVLYTQMIGRPLRMFPGQTEALILDVVGLTSRMRLRLLASLDGAPPVEDIPDDLLLYLDDELDEVPEDEPRGEGPAEDEPTGSDGPLVAELVDLFSASHTAWQQSPRGVWFLATGDGRAVFLAPADELGAYDVRTTDGTATTTEHEAVQLDAAMTWGEKLAEGMAAREVTRAAAWRRKKATLADKWAALSAGATPEDFGRDAGGVRDVIDRQWAATAIDTQVCVRQVTPAGYWTTY